MIRVVQGELANLVRENELLKRKLFGENQRNSDIESALVELADLASAQDDALVEIAELIGG